VNTLARKYKDHYFREIPAEISESARLDMLDTLNAIVNTGLQIAEDETNIRNSTFQIH
jgi:hypothetical protein